MTFDQLEIIEKIVEHGSFAAAAKALHRTQPTLSVAVKKLEAEFDLEIFSRDEYRPKLTEAGRVFFEWAQQALVSFRRVDAVGRELGTKRAEPRLTVVIDPVAQFEAVRAIFSECLSDLKATELTLRSEIFSVGTEAVRSGAADFAITPKVEDFADVESFAVERVEMIPVIASTRATRSKTTPAWLRSEPQIVVSAGGKSLGLLAGGKRCYVTDHALKRRLIAEGYGWGRLAWREAEAGLADGSLTRLPEDLAPAFFLELHVMRGLARPMGPVARSVWRKLREEFGG